MTGQLITLVSTPQGWKRRSGAGSPPVVVQPGIADAGALPLGTASYPVPAGALFVSPSGSDIAAGTQAAPLKTLATAVSKVAAGGTIVMRAGTYFEGTDTQNKTYPSGVTISKSVNIQNYPGETVWFDGSRPVTGTWTQEGSYWWAPYDRIFNRSPTSAPGVADGWGAGTGAGGWWTTPENPQACWPDMIFWDGAQLAPVAAKTDLASGKFWIQGTDLGSMWFQGSRVYVADNPAGHTVEYAAMVKFATFAGVGNTSSVKGIGIRRYATYNAGFGAVYMQHANTWENVQLEDFAAGFTQLDSAPSTTFTKVTGRRFGLNFVTSNKADNMLYDRVDLQQANHAGFNVYGPTTGVIRLAKCQHVTLRDSILSNNNSNGFWCDQTTNTPIVTGCLFENNVNRPIDFETASGGIAANNKFINNGSVGTFINDSDTCRLWNNTYAGNAWGYVGTGAVGTDGGVGTSTSVAQIQVGQSPRRYDVSQYSYCYDSRLGAAYYTDHPDHQWTINHFEVVNNVIAEVGDHTYAMIICGNNGDSTRNPARTWRDMTPKVDGNVYQWGSRRPNYPWAWGNGYQQNYSIYYDLPNQVAGTGLDQHSTFVTASPLDSNKQITDQSLHDNALPLPADIAALIGQPANTRHAGAFW